jgi:hypothetical protein
VRTSFIGESPDGDFPNLIAECGALKTADALENPTRKALSPRAAVPEAFWRNIVAISMYDVSVPVFAARLKALSGVLEAAEKNAAERKIDPNTFLTSRLAPDMFTLARQVQIATDHAKGAPSRLAGRDVPKYEDNEASFAELQTRIAKVGEHLSSFSAADIEGSEDRVIELKVGGRELSMSGSQYLLNFAMPNFYFHLTTAYGILRHNGVPLGKIMFLGGR